VYGSIAILLHCIAQSSVLPGVCGDYNPNFSIVARVVTTPWSGGRSAWMLFRVFLNDFRALQQIERREMHCKLREKNKQESEVKASEWA
jgi:hypothetical protein